MGRTFNLTLQNVDVDVFDVEFIKIKTCTTAKLKFCCKEERYKRLVINELNIAWQPLLFYFD